MADTKAEAMRCKRAAEIDARKAQQTGAGAKGLGCPPPPSGFSPPADTNGGVGPPPSSDSGVYLDMDVLAVMDARKHPPSILSRMKNRAARQGKSPYRALPGAGKTLGTGL